ncbi:hypothetical protein F4802DRAFT_605343 [Xylaria palmicola]|nr:hypothetical protein F4802DRAFT_605343 [Xylaria palmicola]
MAASTGSAEYGRRLVPHVIDDIASKDPQREIVLTARSSDPRDGWAPITFSDYANAINQCAQDIIDRYGRTVEGKFPTIAYIGPQDARYLIVLVATIKAGYQALFISPRNSQRAQINLFEKTDCRILWFAKPFHLVVKSWLQEREMQTLEVSPLQQWFPTEQVPHFSYEKCFEQAEWDPFCIMHTSGTTGLPKPIVARVGMMAISDAHQRLDRWQGSHYWLNEYDRRVKKQFFPMPLFHAAALYSFFYHSVYRNTITILGIGEKPLSADLVFECLENVNFEGAFLPPSILEEISHSEESMSKLSKLEIVIFGGGNLAREVGDRLVKHEETKVHRFGSLPIYFHQDPEAWAYFKFNSELFGADWRPFHDGSYELVMIRKDKEPGIQGFFYTFPHLDEYRTGDLYKRHPTLPDFWIHHGRADNIIVFSNGEKLNPVTLEEVVQDQPDVQGALVIGSNRFQAGLLLEPSEHLADEEDKRRFIGSVWPIVEKVNRGTVAHGQISREMITVATYTKPFLRSGKGSIQRADTVQLYAEEIDNLYKQAENGSQLPVADVDMSSEETLTASISNLFGEKKLEPDTDFFAIGIDSLQIMNVSRSLRASLSLETTVLSARVIYRNPTPRRLAQYILRATIGSEAETGKREDNEDVKISKSLYEKYTHNLIPGKTVRPAAPNNNQTILLTGSTGGLGSYLLDQLVRSTAVKRVICLNRAEDGGARQQEQQMKNRGLTQEPEHMTKIEYLHVDLSNDRLGLAYGLYKALLKDVHRIIHNAWPVNFNISIETLEPHLRGVRRLADFAAEADHRIAVVFISSIGAVHNWGPSWGPVPEKRLEDWRLPSNSYGYSKMTGSLILEDAAFEGNFPAASIRVGQIAGSESEVGAPTWNKNEWLPSMIASSLYMGVLPRELGSNNRVDWVPVERVAQLVLDIAGVTHGRGMEPRENHGYFHAVNASVTTWGKLAPAVQQFYGSRIKHLVSWPEWVDRLEKSSTDARDIEANPGLKLIETYRGMASGATPIQLDLRRANERSRAMAEAPMVSAELLSRWLRQWNF